MFENRDRQIDLIALFLGVITVCLALSLISYSPSDFVGETSYPISQIYQPDVLVYPASEECNNYCGRAGAFAAGLTLTYVGWGSYMIVGTMGV